jgi:hypothetical protein
LVDPLDSSGNLVNDGFSYNGPGPDSGLGLPSLDEARRRILEAREWQRKHGFAGNRYVR